MALVYTDPAKLKSTCPDFELKAMDEKTYSLQSFKDSSVLIFMFICNHCPYVQAIEDRIISFNKSLKEHPVQLIGVCSNDANEYPDDSFEELQKQWKEKNYGFPYLFDEEQTLAKAFNAVCTPDIFVYNNKRELAYRGRFDDSWNDPQKVSSFDLEKATFDILERGETDLEQVPSMGCSIKWKS